MVRIVLEAALCGIVLFAGCCYYTPASPNSLVPPAETWGHDTMGHDRNPPAILERVPIPASCPVVRVRLATGATTIIGSDAGLRLAGGGASTTVPAGQTITVTGDGIVIDNRVWHDLSDTIAVSSESEGRVWVHDRAYRGSFLVFRSADSGVAVVNVLGLEEYLFGVVPCEIGPINEQTLEAVKAQAVAARSFTLARIGKRKGLGHDLFDSYERDQEYRGTGRETELGRQAVSATAGEVLMYAGEVAEALYHGNCGGVTSNGSQPYLKSVRDAPAHGRRAYCSGSPNFTWEMSVSRDSLDAVVSRLAGTARKVRSVRLDTDGASGRVKYLYFDTGAGSVRVHGMDFRSGMGLRSQNFTMTIRGKTLTIKGRGWGHGSGMCQDGAVGMAREGADYRRILSHYYSGVSLKRVY